MFFLPIAINSGHSCLCLSWSFVNTFARRPANTMPPATSAAKPATCQLCRMAVGASPPCTTHHKNKSLAIDRASFFLMFVRAPLFPQLFNGKNYIVREGRKECQKSRSWQDCNDIRCHQLGTLGWLPANLFHRHGALPKNPSSDPFAITGCVVFFSS